MESSPENDGIDRLSELPNHILVHILTFLPILHAVRTVLIRRFGDLWTLLPSLIFDYTAFFERPRGEILRKDDYLRFVNFVRNVLLLHKRVSIDKFELFFPNITANNFVNLSFDKKEFMAWISFAIHRQVKNLRIKVHADGSILPHCLFTSQFLVKLELCDIRINELSRVKMGSLTKLSLMCCEVSNEAMRKIILGSPTLQELDLYHVRGLNELRFTAPNIQKLHLISYNGLLDSPNLKFLKFDSKFGEPMQILNVSSICEVYITRCDNPYVLEEYMEKCSNAEVFKCNVGGLMLSKFKDQDFPQTKWKRLHIESRLCGDYILVLCRILRSSPQLEELIVSCSYGHNSSSPNDILCRELPSCLMQQLKTITLSSCYEVPCHGLLQLAEFLLQSCVTLEKMLVLQRMLKSAASNELEFVNQLLSFPRASTNARVIFNLVPKPY